MSLTTWMIGAAVLGALAAAPAGAEDAKTPLDVTTIMDVMARPVASRETALDDSLRDAGPAPARSLAEELARDGTIRYGNATISVKRPCPVSAPRDEPRPLPGRRQ